MRRWLLAVFLAVPTLALADEPSFTRREVIYGRKFGMALTMDVFTPKKAPNGAGVIFAVSEGWYSNHSAIAANLPLYVQPLIDRGYTVFAVCHGGNPKFALPEIIDDMGRAVRFIRHDARSFGIDPGRIGITGDSAGGHLSLMMGCAGREGNLGAEDPVDRESGRVQAVVAFFPPTDFLNWGEDGKRMLGNHPTVPVQGAFDFQRLDPDIQALRLVTDAKEREELGRLVSPITHVAPGNAPTLIVHGDADTLIPIQQSRSMAAKLKSAGVTSQLVEMKGGAHDEVLVRAHMPDALTWFDKFLAKPAELPRPDSK